MIVAMSDIWNPILYDKKHAFVSNYGHDLIDLLDPKPKEKILDLGCGTGDLANTLFKKNADVVGVDQSKKMILQAKDKYPHIDFLVKDATKLGYDSEFDAVFSNATLHWVKEPEQALISIYKSLKQNGRFIAEFGGKGNIQTVTDEINAQLTANGLKEHMRQFPWYFPSIGEYSSLMEKVGFRVTFAQHFDRPTILKGHNGLKNWITMFGSDMFKNIDKHKRTEIITKVEENLKTVLFKEGNWMADYKRIRVTGIKV